ncbi:hypothetical protein [Xanthomarina sp. F2636L]|uniref:hypothetical protein n=1 Tax=Xanthomarina sp. F2636L TaxID=2996018 RepID=UPI00225DE513|nr:hypothetical protein [Xanthomarina sp. F2636L]MCX7551180.1 hypothetical protein [Xanthomarina sp. F2636L]
MKKTTISLCFTIIFTSFISVPLIITIIDESVDISMFYSVNEGKNYSNNEIKHKELIFLDGYSSEMIVIKLQLMKPLDFNFIDYSRRSLETSLPPPESTS